ncbi:MAG: hypothetical protein DRJ26_04315 [Candidatus Methanomethylicota archaeon]|uniref:Uncharacterized protein n=1 Tax=Thermoproteota archaeon TaxID=2056631 RepID=A0A497EUL1_9CREN|nr:MAG: hypothetical protein DRJ20_02865 [Candidatus Verstraetearchaeota archaeon]RLE52747.1 MAG: hypothetical protein DRJ26_04315 [Candidatus Verstraetearchaeota archaeon]
MFPSSLELTPERKKELIDKIANEIVKRGLETPAIMFLETIKPLTWVGAELSIVYVLPFVKAYIQHPVVDDLVALFHDRDAVELLIKRIEELVEIQKEKERAIKEAKKKAKAEKGKKRRWWIFG